MVYPIRYVVRNEVSKMRFIHMADIHMGAVPDRGKSWSQKRSEEIEATFYGLLKEAGRQGIDLILIAGDIFHRPELPSGIHSASPGGNDGRKS